jgi:hypothetical protein
MNGMAAAPPALTSARGVTTNEGRAPPEWPAAPQVRGGPAWWRRADLGPEYSRDGRPVENVISPERDVSRPAADRSRPGRSSWYL